MSTNTYEKLNNHFPCGCKVMAKDGKGYVCDYRYYYGQPGESDFIGVILEDDDDTIHRPESLTRIHDYGKLRNHARPFREPRPTDTVHLTTPWDIIAARLNGLTATTTTPTPRSTVAIPTDGQTPYGAYNWPDIEPMPIRQQPPAPGTVEYNEILANIRARGEARRAALEEPEIRPFTNIGINPLPTEPVSDRLTEILEETRLRNETRREAFEEERREQEIEATGENIRHRNTELGRAVSENRTLMRRMLVRAGVEQADELLQQTDNMERLIRDAF